MPSVTINDKFSRPTSGGGALSTQVQTARSTGSGSLLCNSLVGWPLDTPVHFITYKVTTDANGNQKVQAGTEVAWKGIVNGNTINSLVATQGSDIGNAVGDFVVALPTAQWGKDLVDGILQEHNQDGTHGTIANLNATNATVTGTLNASGASSVILPAASVKSANVDWTTLFSQQFNGVKSNPAQLRIEMGTVAIPTASNNYINTNVTFSTPFNSVPIVFASAAGATTAGGQSYPATSQGAYGEALIAHSSLQKTTGFQLTVGRGSSNFTSGHTVFATWIAIGY